MDSKSVSYRRNRGYNKQFDWTYELNKDLYESSLKAKANLKLGYMNRMKIYWDKIHPELNYFLAKNLRDQATRVQQRKIFMETEFNSQQKDNLNSVVNNIDDNNDNNDTLETNQTHYTRVELQNIDPQELPDFDKTKSTLKNLFDNKYQLITTM